MRNCIFAYLQYITPHHLLTSLMGCLARVRTPWLKNWMIRRFIKKFSIDMSIAKVEDPTSYPDFNHFFIRELKAGLRPISEGIACPVDGTIAQIGHIDQDRLFQAKKFYFNLESLLGGDKELAETFADGSFSTLYLAPKDYHRVHMPLSGTLTHSIFVPGKLFSVNRVTSEFIPNLYARNERLITVFDTEAGPMAVILVGAMVVGSIQTVWMDEPIRSKHIRVSLPHEETHLEKGAELGHFKLGSTVILLFAHNKTSWKAELKASDTVQVGQSLGMYLED